MAVCAEGKTRATMIRHPEAGARDEWRRDLGTRSRTVVSTRQDLGRLGGKRPCPGEYHYEAQDLIMDIAHELGLRVIVQLYLDSAPDWLSSFYPDSRYVSAGGDAKKFSRFAWILLRPSQHQGEGRGLHAGRG